MYVLLQSSIENFAIGNWLGDEHELYPQTKNAAKAQPTSVPEEVRPVYALAA